MQRISFLDITKGIGIIAVVIGHSIRPDILPAHFISMWHMPLFFFVSGMCFNVDKYCSKLNGAFLKSRIKSLLVPLLMAMLIFCTVFLITGYEYYTPDMILDMRVPFALWFLVSLFCCQTAYWLWCLIAKAVGRIPLYISEALFVMANVAVAVMFESNNIELPFSLHNVPLAIAFYGFGHLLRNTIINAMEHASGMKSLVRFGIIAFEILYLAAFIVYGDDAISFADNHLPHPWPLTLMVSLLSIDAVMKISNEIDKAKSRPATFIARCLNYLGTNTLTILIFHMWWMRLCKDFLRPIIGIGIEPLLVWLLLIPTIYIINRYTPWIVGKRRSYAR